MSDLLVIVPSKGRPDSLKLVAEAWYETDAFADGAGLIFAVDSDDPTWPRYRAALADLAATDPGPTTINLMNAGTWQPMVPKLNAAAMVFADQAPMLGFAGDDHRPRSKGWARRYINTLQELGTGIVYGTDLVQAEKLPTQWAMTSDIVRSLGRMVPADVEHLYCDNAILDLGQAADCIRYLPDVQIEHCHPLVGRGAWDAGYERVNSRAQYAADHARYMAWRTGQCAADAAAVRTLFARPPTT